MLSLVGTAADERDVGARLSGEVEVTQNTDARTGRVAEVDALETDTALDRIGERLGVDLGNRVEQPDDVGCRGFGRGDVRHE